MLMRWLHRLIHGKPKVRDGVTAQRLREAETAARDKAREVEHAAVAQQASVKSVETYSAAAAKGSKQIELAIAGVLADLNRRNR